MRLIYEDDKEIIVRKDNSKTEFTMADQNLFIGMYRDTIYKNKLRVIPQEYMANARDAHREVGKDDVPIKVYLPTVTDPMLIIQDYGPGINEERSKIFSQYGASTKRGSDRENGGFGIGCKCAWSYTESFTVDTVFEDDGKKINRIYSIYITHQLDPGNLRLVSEKEVSDEVPTGTKVCIPIMVNDIRSISRSVYTTGSFWDVRPVIFNNCYDIKFYTEDNEPLYYGNGWKCFNDVGNDLYGSITKSFVVIDGVCYKLDYDILSEGKSQYEDVNGEIKEVIYNIDRDTIHTIRRLRIVVFLDINEVTVAPDRENLDYSVRTIKMLRDKFNDAVSCLTAIVNDKLKSASYFEVIKIINDFNTALPIKIEWTDPITNIKFDDIIRAVNFVTNSNCRIVSRENHYSSNKLPINILSDKKVAFIQYSTKSGALSAARRLIDYVDDTLDYMGVDYVVMFYERNECYKPLITHSNIKTVRNNSTKLTAVGIYDGFDNDVADVSLIEPNSSFVIRRHNVCYIIKDNGALISIDIKILRVIFEKTSFYSVSTAGERCLKKAGIEIKWVDGGIIRNRLVKVIKSHDSLYYYTSICYEVRSFIKNYGDSLEQWAISNNRRSVAIAIKLIRKIYENENGYDYYVKSRIESLCMNLGIKYPGICSKYVRSAEKAINRLPFINIDVNGKDHKKIMRNIFATYKEVY